MKKIPSRHVDAATGLNDTNNFNVNGGLEWRSRRRHRRRQLADRDLGFGIEGDASRVGQRGTSPDNGPVGVAGFSSFTKEDWLSTVRGRVGFAANNALFYGTAGYAVAGTRSGVYSTATGTVFDQSDDTRSGWTAAAGIEWGFLPDLTVKVEYLYVQLANKPLTTVNLGPAFNRSSVPFNDNIVRVGLNWRRVAPGTVN